MTLQGTKDASTKRLKDAISSAPKGKVIVRNGKIEVESEDGEVEEVSEIQKHEFK